MPTYQYIIIVGCGRLGSILANQLSRLGSNVVVIDRDERTFSELTTDFSGFTVVGDASEMTVLHQAGIKRADCLLAISRYDNINLMVAQVAKRIFKVSKVIARVYNPDREMVYRQVGIETICPTKVTIELFLQALGDGHLEKRL
jgi:trk system potassium uptake protein TrkA